MSVRQMPQQDRRAEGEAGEREFVAKRVRGTKERGMPQNNQNSRRGKVEVEES
jgi:hypothetical protein